MEEVWLPIPEQPGYEASSLGRIRSKFRVLVQSDMGTGYRVVSCSVANRARNQRVHRLVLQAFVGPCPAGMECRHLDGDRSNNALANLAWGTKWENAADRDGHGTTARGVRGGTRVLNDESVHIIRSSSRTSADLARDLGVDRTTVSLARRGKTWGHLR